MDSLPIIIATYTIYKNIVEINYHLERRWKFSLGMSLENTALSLLEQLIMAKHAPKSLKASYLIKAVALLEVLRLKVRLLLEFKICNETKVFQIQSKIAEIGRMLGGWLKASSGG